MKVNKREQYFDFLRGIAIILVIGIHSNAHYFRETQSITNLATGFLFCAVPIFLALSGYFIAQKKNATTFEEYKVSLKKQIIKIYIPFLLLQLPLYFSYVYKGIPILNCTIIWILGGFKIYYFPLLIIQYYFLFPLLNKNCNKLWQGIYIIISLTSITFVDCNYNFLSSLTPMPFVVTIGTFPIWICFFSLGIYLAKNEQNSILTPTLVLIATLFVSLVFGIKIGYNAIGFIYSYSIILILFSNRIKSMYKSNNFTNVIAWLGLYSYTAYLIHNYFTDLIDIDSFILRWGLATIATVSVIYILKRICPNTISRYIGIYN